MADHLASDGYAEVGYVQINVDDCFLAMQRDSKGRLQVDSQRFPSGMKAISDYIHKKGLKLGVYTDCGTNTCAGFPGSEGYIELDAETYA